MCRRREAYLDLKEFPHFEEYFSGSVMGPLISNTKLHEEEPIHILAHSHEHFYYPYHVHSQCHW